ncbi:hypothetical protein BKI52_27550 [marine bacterium AO1-C]|nr:hypothetical protein BKI52_27550 [marine bacterium AO1-C]
MGYYPGDLFNHYVQAFFKRGVFGMKAYDVYDKMPFILRGRYLLSTVNDKVIEDLFLLAEQKEASLWESRGTLITACWLSGLLKKRCFLPKIIQVIKEKDEAVFYSSAWLGALFLYDDEALITPIQHFIDKHFQATKSYRYHKSYYQAMYCLQLWDKQKHSNYAQKYAPFFPSASAHSKTLLRFLEVSKILRANITFDHSATLQTGLKTLLAETTTLSAYFDGLLVQPKIRSYAEGMHRQQHFDLYCMQFKQKYQEKTAQVVAPSEFLLDHPYDKIKRSTHQFEHAVRTYLHTYRSQIYPIELKKAALLAQDSIDILAGLEIDLAYQLPIEIIDICYQKLLQVLPHSFYLYEAYALALLMRGNQHDKRAKALYKNAQQIRAKYEWIEEDDYLWWGRYVQVKN